MRFSSKASLGKNLLAISNEVRSSARKKLKIRPEGGEKVNRPLVGIGRLSKERSVERLISLFGIFRED